MFPLARGVPLAVETSAAGLLVVLVPVVVPLLSLVAAALLVSLALRRLLGSKDGECGASRGSDHTHANP